MSTFRLRDRGSAFRGSGFVALHHYRLARQAPVLLRCTTTVLHGKPDPVLILARGRVMEDGMGTLVFICPATGEEVSTGIEMDHATVNQLDLAKVFCPHCRQPHHMVGVEYWLSQVDEPAPLEEAAEAA